MLLGRLIRIMLLIACTQLRPAIAVEPELKLSDERVVFQTKFGDFEFAFLPEVNQSCCDIVGFNGGYLSKHWDAPLLQFENGSATRLQKNFCRWHP